MVLNLSESESADLGRMLQSRSWALVLRHIQDVAVKDRNNILAGQITQDRLLELRASQASLQRVKGILNDVYQAAKLKLPTNFENMVG